MGGLPEKMHLKVVEPLRMLFKDEVRRVGKELNIDTLILGRHPFPGPGLAIRIIGPITEERVNLLQEADAIFISALKRENLYDKVWQAGVILLNTQAVGVMGDERTYNLAASAKLYTVDPTDYLRPTAMLQAAGYSDHWRLPFPHPHRGLPFADRRCSSADPE